MMRHIALLVLLLATPVEHHTKPRFHVGQVVAVVYDTAVPQYFRVGYIDREVYTDGKTYFLYTDATEKIDGEWPETALRALTREECK